MVFGLVLLGSFVAGGLAEKVSVAVRDRQMAREREAWGVERGRLLDRLQAPQFVVGQMPEVPPVEQMTDEAEWQREVLGDAQMKNHVAFTVEEYAELAREGFKEDD